MKNIAKLCTLIVAGTCFSLFAENSTQTTTNTNPVSAPSFNISVISSTHPASEPKGLFVVDFRVQNASSGNSNDFKYRIYCPNLTVRNITPGQKTGELMTVAQEDALTFENYPVLAQVSNSVCDAQASSSKGLPQ